MPKFKLTKHPSGIYSLKRVKKFNEQKLFSAVLCLFLIFGLIAGIFSPFSFPHLSKIREAQANPII